MNHVRLSSVWQDREVRFDSDYKELKLRPGEVEMESLENVEDVKSSNMESGRLVVTNLRLTWCYYKNSRVNLSVGWNSVRTITIQEGNASLANPRLVVFLLCKHNNGRFEFIFASSNRRTRTVLNAMPIIQKSYASTKLFRDLKLRGAVIKHKQVILLPGETIYRKVSGVWNVSRDQGNLGSFFVTNVRVIWYAELAENFNVSIPYMQMTSISVHKTQFGDALVIQTTSESGGFKLGFRIDPVEMLKTVEEEMKMLYGVYAKKPNFGVTYTKTANKEEKAPEKREKIQIVNTSQMEHFDTLTRYYADPGKGEDRVPVYDKTLGLAVEKPKADIEIQKLWAVIV